MIATLNTGKELYVYMNGKLLYKRWIQEDYGMVFCDVWGNRPFTCKNKKDSLMESPITCKGDY